MQRFLAVKGVFDYIKFELALSAEVIEDRFNIYAFTLNKILEEIKDNIQDDRHDLL